jgi:hypothetical protein
MGMSARKLIRSAGWAFLLDSGRDGRGLQKLSGACLVGLVILTSLLLSILPLWAQHNNKHVQTSVSEEIIIDHTHHVAAAHLGQWEGSIAGIAYSEFNHHLAGMLVLIIGLSELRQALNVPFWAWTRFLLPGALLTAGSFLLVWSDHDAWPIGSLGFMQTFFVGDSEIFQHKSYGLLSLAVGTIELFRRLGQLDHTLWVSPLPLFAIIGGLMLFGHSHGGHPLAHRIAMDHALMGTMAVTAGSSKLLSDWFRSPSHKQTSKWELIWAGLLLLIGIQLLVYSE